MNDLTNLIFSETNNTIRCKKQHGKLWVCAIDLAAPLGKSKQAIHKQIAHFPSSERSQFLVVTSGGRQTSTFLSLDGAINVIMKTYASPGSIVDRFQWWASRKLRELITTGETSLYQRRLKIVDDWTTLLSSVLRETRDDEKDKEYNKSISIVKNNVDFIEAGGNSLIPIQQRLIFEHGIEYPQICRLARHLGKHIVKPEYVKRYGCNPGKILQEVNAKLYKKVWVFAYKREDYEDWIDTLISEYISNQSIGS